MALTWKSMALIQLGEGEREALIANLHPIKETEVTLLKELGRGQFGTVWLGSWHGTPVAVKQMHREDSYQVPRRVVLVRFTAKGVLRVCYHQRRCLPAKSVRSFHLTSPQDDAVCLPVPMPPGSCL